MSPRSISIVVPTHNKCGSLRRTLASLERQQPGETDLEVIVVDDASTDETARWLASHRPAFPFQRLHNARNTGPAAARNRGFRHATGEVVLFLDDDMECEPGLVRAHLAHHQSGEDVAVVGRALYHPELPRSALTRYFDAQHKRHDSPLCPPVRVATNNLSMSRSLFERAGMYDESLGVVGLEDVELGLRLAAISGCVLLYEPKAFAWHYHDQSLRDYMRKVEAAGASNLPILASRHASDLDKGALGWLVTGPADGAVKQAVRLLLSAPLVPSVLAPLAEWLPGDGLNRLLVKYLLASSMLRGYRRSAAAAPSSEMICREHST